MGEARVISLEDIRRYGGMHAVLVDGEIVAASEVLLRLTERLSRGIQAGRSL